MQAFVTGLGQLVDLAGDQLAGGPHADLTPKARDLGRLLAALRAGTLPLTSGIVRWRGRASAQRSVDVLASCDRWARGLTRVIGPATGPFARQALMEAARGISANLDGLADTLDGRRPEPAQPSQQLLDAAQTAIDAADGNEDERRRLTLVVHYLRPIDHATLGLRDDLDRRRTRQS